MLGIIKSRVNSGLYHSEWEGSPKGRGYTYRRDFPGVSVVKNVPAIQGTWVQPLSQEDPLEKGMATDSSTLAWRIPWTEEPGRLQSIGSQSGTQWKQLNSSSICTHAADSSCCTVKRTQHCKATIHQQMFLFFKKKKLST